MGKFDNIVIATDLDGTFLNKDKKIVPRNIERIEYFKSEGGKFTIATGRILSGVKTAIPNVAELINLPVVLNNGGCLYDCQKNECILEYTIAPHLVRTISEYVMKDPVKLGMRMALLNSFAVIDDQNPIIAEEIQKIAQTQKMIGIERYTLENCEQIDPYRISLRADDETLNVAAQELTRKFGDELEINMGAKALLDIQPKGHNKAYTLLELMAMLNNGRSEENKLRLYTVGDYENDLEMHKVADVAVCPANAIDSVKSVCDITLCDHDEGVIGDLIDYLDKQI